MKVFDDRADAGRQLGEEVGRRLVSAGHGDDRIVVLAVPRGGVPVAVEVADVLGAELDVVVHRKLRTPDNPEMGFGAVGPDGHLWVDREVVERFAITDEQIAVEVADRRAVVESRLAMYRVRMPAVPLDGATVVVVDDGVATGGTAAQALELIRAAGADRVVLATPIAPAGAEEAFEGLADDVVVLSTPAEFLGVAQGYRDFPQLDDQAVLAALPGR